MHNKFRQGDIDIGGDSVVVSPAGSSVATAMPTLEQTGGIPTRVRISTDHDGGVFFKLGQSGVVVGADDGTLVNKYQDLYVKTLGRTHFAHIDQTGGAMKLCITPLND